MNLKGFVRECHKKEVFKMLSIYIVSSWVILQVLALITEPLGLPIKSVTYLIIILLIGFPVYVYYIWKYRLLKFEIQQTNDPSTPYNKSAFQKIYFSSLLVISLLSGVAITLIIKNNFGKDFSLEKINSNNKIAVLEFENNTGDDKLDYIGKIAANWIINGIENNQIANVISPKIISDYSNILKSQAGTLDLNNILNNYFKPGKKIEGVFYKEKGKLLLQGSIKDGANKSLITFSTFTCDPDSPTDCVEALKQKILGYLKTEGNVAYFESKPPKFEALKYNQMALDNLDKDSTLLKYLNKAITTDPDFFEPKIHKIAYYYNKGEYKIADSLRVLIDHDTHLSPRQENIMLFYKYILMGKNDRTYEAHQKEYKIASLDLATNMTDMTIALQFVNRPEDINAKYNEIEMDSMIIENCTRCGFRYYLKGLADVELGNFKEVIKTLVPVTNKIDENYLKRPLISAYVKAGQDNELDNYLSDYALTASKENMRYLNVFTGIQYLNANKIDEANTYFNKVITEKSTKQSNPDVAKAYFYKGDYNTAENLYKQLYNSEPNNIDFLVALAICYFNNGNFIAAKTQIEKLNSLRSDYQFGSIDYGWAQYYATIGDKVKAMEFLKKSVAQGYRYTPSTFQHDYHFKNLKDTPDFNNEIMDYWKNKIQ